MASARDPTVRFCWYFVKMKLWYVALLMQSDRSGKILWPENEVAQGFGLWHPRSTIVRSLDVSWGSGTFSETRIVELSHMSSAVPRRREVSASEANCALLGVFHTNGAVWHRHNVRRFKEIVHRRGCLLCWWLYRFSVLVHIIVICHTLKDSRLYWPSAR